MKIYNVVIDTNVIVSALKSRNGFSFKLLTIIDNPKFQINISVPLILEYEEVLKREKSKFDLTINEIETIIDFICSIGNKKEIYFLWRPFLKDPKDDMILELAVESDSEIIITFNTNDFVGVDRFGIKTMTPKEFLITIGEVK
ncbi:MAG: putative toxin-antitoxin system toxin component, PIN family [Ignavibacteriaceae bacterium]|jgi:putative PIN family toxin of toxin-antitoxin system|nr:putative toxin-antitoxin system toxin component, PIN family [Ignavibacteriaceae bacterium]